MRKTKIVCTIGPVSEDENTLKKLINAGMDVARFNFSHGDYEEHRNRFITTVNLAKKMNKPIATMMDTKGPEIRLRDFDGGSAILVKDQKFTLTTDEIMGNANIASITYKNLINDITIGKHILIDDGLIELEIVAIEENNIVCRVLNGGKISNHKGINVPQTKLSMPYLSDIDISDILFGIEMGYDYIAASFARDKEDIIQVKKLINENGSNMKIIAKIENMQGIDNLDDILAISDGIMVARGDMGVEVPIEDVPVIQKLMIDKALKAGKMVITATQMLESMINNPRPTRAEVADVANAIYDGTSAIMLSGETACGNYPIEAVETMAKIALKTEQNINYRENIFRKSWEIKDDVTAAISHACCTTAMELDAVAIITVSMTGFTARMLSRYQPDCPIIGCAVTESVYRQMAMMFDVEPLMISRANDTEKLFEYAIEASLNAGYIQKGDKVVVTAGIPLGIAGHTNMIRVIESV
ncbi:MAG: pyruvate kinase [Lachnospiraceae bacterium]|nr:pyruvate kinase [Lachnospiraceae bacterium]